MVDETEDLAKVNAARLAHLLLSNMMPILEHVRKTSEAEFLGKFKSGTLDAGNSLAYAAVLGTIEKITNYLKQRINAGDRALEGKTLGSSD